MICSKCGLSPRKSKKTSLCKKCYNESNRNRRKNNLNHYLKKEAEFREKYKEKRKEYNKKYLIINRDRLRKKLNNWYNNHRDVVSVYEERKRAKKRNCRDISLTKNQWEFILHTCNFTCQYCGSNNKKLTKDHIVPLSLGGTHSMDNIMPSCQSCNTRKGINSPPCIIQPFLKLEEL